MSIPSIGEFNKVVKWERVNKSSDNAAGQNEQYVEWFTGRMALKKMSQARKLTYGYDELVDVYEGWVQWRHEIETNMTKDVRAVIGNRFYKLDLFDLIDDKRGMYKVTLKSVR